MEHYSDYIVYVDESGDHNLEKVDPQYPIFVLSLCIFHKKHYSSTIVPKVKEFKFKHFGHDLTVLHEHAIRKEHSGFLFKSKNQKDIFINELSDIVNDVNFVLISCVIKKENMDSPIA